VRLFRRLNRALVLTEEGQAYCRPVREAFEKLADASRRLRVREQSGALTVSVMASFAAKWLVPRLRGFREQHPEIDVRVSATEKLVDFDREDVDVAIRYGRGNWPGLRMDRLLREALFPVCSPKLLKGPVPLRKPADLVHHNLLHDSDWREDWWVRWFAAAGIDSGGLRRALSFNHSNLMLQAAIDGLGVALSQEALAGDDLAAGRLVKPFDIELASEHAYYVVAPEATAERPKVKAFRDWLLAEAQRARESLSRPARSPHGPRRGSAAASG
jgi:LysR family glycine cleavage system transcriptional activator